MRYIFDNDMHIHSYLSPCSGNPAQTAERILQYGIEEKLRLLVLTDHFWDGGVPLENNGWRNNDVKDNAKILPLPQADGIAFLYGAEADMSWDHRLGLRKETFSNFDFVTVAINHLHMKNFTAPDNLVTYDDYRRAFLTRADILFASDIPLRRCGLAHLTCSLGFGYNPGHVDFYRTFEDAEWRSIFDRAAAYGTGIELNFPVFSYTEKELDEVILRPYRIAKECGCRFFFGSDAHSPEGFSGMRRAAERIIDLLELTEDDKYYLPDDPRLH